MEVCLSTTAERVGVGDAILSPVSGKRMLVRAVEAAPFGMLDLRCRDIDGDLVILTLAASDAVKVLT